MKTSDSNSRSARFSIADLVCNLLPAIIIALCGQLSANAAPTLQTDHSTYYPGEDIVVNFASGPGNRLDWIGVYPVGVDPGPTPSTIWNYVDGTQNGAIALSEGSFTFRGGLNTPNDWK